MEEFMTIKQIADLCSVDERSVRRWAEKAGDKMSAIADKMSASTSTYPAAFTLDETLAIIRAGGKNTLADLLADNAQRKETALALRDSVQALIPQITAAVVQAVRSVPALLAPPIPEMPPGYYTIKQYGITRGMWIGISAAVLWGRHASDISRMKGIEIKKIKVPGSEIAQEVNAYHVSVLQEVFTL
jgi:hypothetical protein